MKEDKPTKNKKRKILQIERQNLINALVYLSSFENKLKDQNNVVTNSGNGN